MPDGRHLDRGVNLRPTTAADGPAVDGLLERVLGAVSRPLGLYRPLHGPAADQPRLRRSFVVVDGDDLVGVGSAIASTRHPGRHQVAVHVVRPRRRRGIGRELLEALAAAMAEAGHPASWMVSVLETDATSRAVLDHLRWSTLVTSRAGTLEVEASSRRGTPPPGVGIAARDGLDEDLVELYEDLYDQYHRWARPYVRRAEGRAWASFLGDPLPGSVHVALVDDRPVSVVSLHGDPACPLLAPTGVLEGVPEGRRIMAALVAAVLDAAREVGITEMEWEADDTYAELWSALRPLSLDRWDDLLVVGS